MNGWEAYIGLAVAVAYFGIMNSSDFQGQTLGKRILKIRVVDKNGQYIPMKTSLFRALLLQLPFFFFNGLTAHYFPNFLMPVAVLIVLASLFLAVGLPYFYLFNSQTRQSIHDLICKTYVVPEGERGEFDTKPAPKFHYVIVSVISGLLFLIIFLPMVLSSLSPAVSKNQKLENELSRIHPVKSVSAIVRSRVDKEEGYDTEIFYINMDEYPKDSAAFADKAEQLVREMYRVEGKYDALSIVLTKQCSIGIAGIMIERTYNYRLNDKRDMFTDDTRVHQITVLQLGYLKGKTITVIAK